MKPNEVHRKWGGQCSGRCAIFAGGVNRDAVRSLPTALYLEHKPGATIK